jgi:hypothetical protein
MNTPDNPDKDLCPFSKPILGDWCQCPHAQVMDRCSGKMSCTSRNNLRKDCLRLVELLRNNASFVLGISGVKTQLTHSQYMKIKCGGIQGMQRVLEGRNARDLPMITEIIADARDLYGNLEHFPYAEIVGDIQSFSHRKPSRK